MKTSFILSLVAVFWSFGAWAESQTDAASAADNSAASSQEVDLVAAEGIYHKVCRACHGNRAQGVASYPKLSDKSPEYLAEKLRIYRSGERVGPNSVLMISNARDLSDEDIANLSVYIATAFD